MSTGKVDVWITLEGDPCRIRELGADYPYPWVVAVWDCQGRVLKWCGREYFNLVTRCGHIELELPPGCYIIRAAEAMGASNGGVWGNYWTDHAVVTVCCGQEVCVTLFAPSAHNCGWGFTHVLEAFAERGAIPRDVAQRAIEANRAVLTHLPAAQFDYGSQETMLQLARAADKVTVETSKGEKPPS